MLILYQYEVANVHKSIIRIDFVRKGQHNRRFGCLMNLRQGFSDPIEISMIDNGHSPQNIKIGQCQNSAEEYHKYTNGET